MHTPCLRSYLFAQRSALSVVGVSPWGDFLSGSLLAAEHVVVHIDGLSGYCYNYCQYNHHRYHNLFTFVRAQSLVTSSVILCFTMQRYGCLRTRANLFPSFVHFLRFPCPISRMQE